MTLCLWAGFSNYGSEEPLESDIYSGGCHYCDIIDTGRTGSANQD